MFSFKTWMLDVAIFAIVFAPGVHAYENQVSITESGGYRYIVSNGVPREHGEFPNANNPNTILPQTYVFKVPLNPVLSGRVTLLYPNMDFGVGLDGVPFDPFTAETWQGDVNWRYEALSGKINLGMDFNHAHVQPNGAYHYHGSPTELVGGASGGSFSPLVGYAADGFPIYVSYGYTDANNPGSGVKELESSYRLKSGTRPSGPGGTYDGTFTQDYEYVAGAGDLDECNGRVGVTPDYPQGTYYYVITHDFPIVPRCYKGTPDASFVKAGGGGGQMQGGPGMGQGMSGGGQQQAGPGSGQGGPGGMGGGMIGPRPGPGGRPPRPDGY